MSRKQASTMQQPSAAMEVLRMTARPGNQRLATFTCTFMPQAQEVYLVGDFNGWSPHATPMVRRNGCFEAEVALEPGEYEYKFVVDGQWMEDPDAPLRRPNPFGGENSVVRV